MNLINAVMMKDPPLKEEKSFIASQKTRVVAEGLCITCSNRPHCVWLENKKLLCEHFD